MMYREKNRVKSELKKLPVDKLRSSDLGLGGPEHNSAQLVNSDACNNNVDGKRAVTSDRPRPFYPPDRSPRPFVWSEARARWQI